MPTVDRQGQVEELLTANGEMEANDMAAKLLVTPNVVRATLVRLKKVGLVKKRVTRGEVNCGGFNSHLNHAAKRVYWRLAGSEASCGQKERLE